MVQEREDHFTIGELERDSATSSGDAPSAWTTRLAAAAAGAGLVLAVLAIVDSLLGLRRNVGRSLPPTPARRRRVSPIPDWLRRAGDSQERSQRRSR
jgi:hypothetical protein